MLAILFVLRDTRCWNHGATAGGSWCLMRHLLTLMTTMVREGPNSNLQMWVDWFFQHCIVVSLLIEYFILKNKEISARQQKKWTQYT